MILCGLSRMRDNLPKVSNRTHGKLLYNDLDPNYGTEPWTRCLIWGKEQFSINRIWASLWTGSVFYTTWPWSPETRPYFRFQKSRGSCRSWTQRSSGSSSSWIAGFRSPSNHSVTWSINLSLQSFAAWLLGMHFKIMIMLASSACQKSKTFNIIRYFILTPGTFLTFIWSKTSSVCWLD